MKTAQKLAAYAVVLVAVFALALWAGKTAGPRDEVTVAHGDAHTSEAATAAPDLPGGLQSTQDGYTLALDDPITKAKASVPLQFRILDADGAPVTRFVESHEKLLHLIVVRNDLATFQHVHPVLGGDGTWRVPLDLSRAGDYRVFADFAPEGGPALTLGANLHVAGSYDPRPLPPAADTAEVDDYTVTLSGTPKSNAPPMITLTVHESGSPVSDLQPYLGAYGHLVALRASDLAYLHVHPAGEPGDGVTPSGPEIRFHTTFPSAGQYRLFLDFQHRGVVRTAAFTVTVDEPGSPPQPGSGHGGHGH